MGSAAEVYFWERISYYAESADDLRAIDLFADAVREIIGLGSELLELRR